MSVPRYTVADAEAAARRREHVVPGGDALVVSGLTIEAPGAARPLVDRVDLVVGRGEAVGLAGEADSGIELVAAAILGVLAPPLQLVDGTLALGGRPGEARRELELLTERGLQDVRGREVAPVPPPAADALDPCRRVDRQLVAAIRRLDPGLRRAAARTRAADLLDAVGIADGDARAVPGALDALDRQRAAVAIALAGGPSLLVCREPAAGLDGVSRARVLDLLTVVRHDLGVALLLLTSDLAAVAATCNRMAVLHAGEVVEDGPTAAVLSAPAHPYTAALVRATPGLAGLAPVHGLAGTAPAVGAPPTGCAFHPRCPVREAACETTRVALRGVGPGRHARCLLADAGPQTAGPAA